MTPAEYMDPARFPRTTQPGLSLRNQMLIDAVNYDDVAEARELGTPIAPEHLATVKELEEKYAVQAQVIEQAKAVGLM